MQEKPFEPTKRKLRKAKERGQVAKSAELISAVMLAGGWLLVWGLSTLLGNRFQVTMKTAFSNLSEPSLSLAMQKAFSPLLAPTLIILFGISVIAFAIHWAQAGWIWTWKKHKGKGSGHSLYRFFFALLKVGVVGGIALLYFWSLKPKDLVKEAFSLSGLVIVALLFLGVIDFIYQKWRFHQEMRMTKEELKEEQKETELLRRRR